MPRTAQRPKRSKSYRPRPVNREAHLVAIMGAALLSQDDQEDWVDRIDRALYAVACGDATQADWREVFDALNLVEQLVIMRKAQDPNGLVQAVQDACVAILDRQRATGAASLLGNELSALFELREAFVTLLSGITHGERFQAGEAVRHRLRRALAGGEPGARLVPPLEQEPA
jgi:hypothetical protein